MSRFEEYLKRRGLKDNEEENKPTSRFEQYLQRNPIQPTSRFQQFLERQGLNRTTGGAESQRTWGQNLVHPINRISDPATRQRAVQVENRVQQAVARQEQQKMAPVNKELLQPIQALKKTLASYDSRGASGFSTQKGYQSFIDEIERLKRLSEGRRTQYYGDAEMMKQFDSIDEQLAGLGAYARYHRGKMVSAQNTVADARDYLQLQEDVDKLKAAKTERMEQLYQQYGDLDAAISEKEEQLDQRSQARKIRKLASVTENADFRQKSGYVSTANGKPVTSAPIQNERGEVVGISYSQTGFDDIVYDYINGNRDAAAIVDNIDDATLANWTGQDHQFLRQLESHEVSIFNYIYNTEGPDAAYQFIDLLKNDLQARQRYALEAETATYARENPALASVGSVAMSPFKGVGYLMQGLDYVTDGKIQDNASYNRFSYMGNAVRNEVSGIIESTWGGVGSLAYQTGMSMGDFLMSTAVSGGNPAFALGIMGTGAAADATLEAKDRGLSDGQAFTLGTIAGATEIALEKLPLEALLGQPKSAVSYLLKNAFSESIEEGGSNIVNTLADIIVAQDKSKWQASMNAYLESGKASNENEAFWLAMKDKALEIGIDALAGGISGGIMGAGGLAAHEIAVNAQIKSMDADAITNAINKGLSYGSNTNSYRIASALEAKVYRDEVITKQDLLQLLQANSEAAQAADPIDTAANSGYDNQNTTGGKLYDAGQVGQEVSVSHRGGETGLFEAHSSPSAETGNRPGISGEMGQNHGAFTQIRSDGGQRRGLTDSQDPYAPEDYVQPENGSQLHQIQHGFSERGIDCKVVRADKWRRKNPAFTRAGKVYISDGIDLNTLSTAIPHESTHVMQQLGFTPYLNFIDATPDALNFGSESYGTLLKAVSEHTGIDVFSMDDRQLTRFYDELNAIVYGMQKAGILADPDYAYGDFIPGAFTDFDSYIGELDSIHEQFARQSKATTPTAPVGESGYEQGVTQSANAIPSGEEGNVARLKSTGQAVTVQKIASVKDGKVTLALEDGRKVDASEVVYGSADEAIVYEAVASLATNAAAANLMLKAYEGSGVSAQVFAKGMEEAYVYGSVGMPLQQMMERGSFVQELTDYQIKIGYDLGQMFGGKQSGKSGKIRKKGRVKAYGIKLENVSKAFNTSQEEAYQILCQIAEVTGIDIVLFESKADADGNLRGGIVDGIDMSDSQGAFSWKNNKIYIDINAGVLKASDLGDVAKYSMLRTFAHEFTHFLEKHNPEQYNAFRELVFEAMRRNGTDPDMLIEDYMKRHQGATREETSREMVAEAMTDILPETSFMEQLVHKHKSLAERLVDKLKEFVAQIKKHFQSMGTNQSKEAAAAKEQLGDTVRYAEGLVEAFDRLAVSAVENYQAAATAQKNTATEGGVQMQVREIGDTGKFYVQADRQVLTGDDPGAWGKQIEKYINEVIRQEQDIAIPTQDGHVLLLTGRSAYKLSDAHVAAIQKKVEAFLTDEDYALKGRAATHIDELIQVARFAEYKPDVNQKHENDIGEDGFNYFEANFRDLDGKYYRVRFSAGLNANEETVYSIGRIRQRRFPASGGSSSKTEALKSGRKPSDSIIYTSAGKSQEVKSAIQLAYEKALAKKSSNEQHQKRTETLTNRDIISQIEGKTDLERKVIKEYQDVLGRARELAQIHADIMRQIDEMGTPSDPKSKKKLAELRIEAIRAKNRRDNRDKQLRSMENGLLAPLIKREKGAVLEKLRNTYGTIPRGEKAVRDDSLPVSVDGETKVSRTARTVKGMEEAYVYGSVGMPLQQMMERGSFVQELTDYQIKIGYDLGQMFGGEQIAKQQSLVRRSKGTPAADTSQGRVHFEGDRSTLNKTQNASLDAMEMLAKSLGVQMYVFESPIGEDGQRKGANGWYDSGDGSVHVDLYAGADGKGTMLFTVAHELTHFVRQWSPAKFKTMANFLTQQYAQKGVAIQELVESQMEKARRNGRELTLEQAYEEVVADSMEAMLTDGNVIQWMAELKQQDQTLWKKIRDWFKNLAGKLRAVVDAYKGVTPDSTEGRLVADMKDVVGILESLYQDALVDGSENYNAAGAQKNTAHEGGVKYSFKGYADDGKGIYESNFPKGTPKKAKGERILQYIQNVWSKKPITLRIEQNGTVRHIEAQFDPTFSEDKNVRTDASKLMGGNRHGNAVEQRVTLDLADDYYQIAEEAQYNYSKDETGKDSETHKDVKVWHYFVNDIYFAEQGSDELTPFTVSINVKEKEDGNFFYSFSAEKTEGTSTRRTLHADVNDGDNAIANGSSSDASIRNPNEIVNKKFSNRDPGHQKVSQMLERENQKLREDVSYLRELVKIQRTVTNGTRFTKSSVEGAAIYLKKAAGAKDGKVTLALEDGRKVDASEVEYGSADEAIVYEAVTGLAANAAAANLMLKAYQGSGVSAQAFAKGMEEAYTYGSVGMPLQQMMERGSFVQELTDYQIKIGYDLGQMFGGKQSGKSGKIRKKGRVKAYGIKLENVSKAFNTSQEQAYQALCQLADVTGIDIVLFESRADAKGNLRGGIIDGIDMSGSQGAFSWQNDKIYIDINAGVLKASDLGDVAKYSMLRTFSHEFTHFLEKHNSEQYEVFRELVFEAMRRNGTDPDMLIEDYMKRHQGATREDTSREMVAEAMTDILPETSFMEQLVCKNKSLAERLVDKLKEFVAQIKKHFQSMGTNQSKEAAAAKEQLGDTVRYAEGLVEAFDRLAVSAVENYQATATTQKNTATDGGVQMQARPSGKNPEVLDPRTVTREDVAEMLEGAKTGKYAGNTYIPVRISTPGIVQERLFAENLPIIMPVSKVAQAFSHDNGPIKGKNVRGHGLSVDQLIDIVERMDSPDYVYSQDNGRGVEVIRLGDASDNTVVIVEFDNNVNPAYMNGYEGGTYNVSVTTFNVDGGNVGLFMYSQEKGWREVFNKQKEGDPAKKFPATRPFAVEQDSLNDNVPQLRPSVNTNSSGGRCQVVVGFLNSSKSGSTAASRGQG